MNLKKVKIPKNFGEALGSFLFDGSQQNIFDFANNLCNGHPKVKESLNRALKHIAQIQDEKLRDSLKYYIEGAPDCFTEILLTLGFALGQAYEIPDRTVQKDIDLAWKVMKEWGLFSMYPKRKKAA